MPYKLINILNTNNLFKLKVAGLQILLSLFLISIGCTQDPKLWKVTSQQQVITDFLACNPHKYSEFNNLLVSIKLTDLLKVRGPYTLFLPSNEAMANYYMEKGISSYAELTQQEQKDLAYNHLIVNDEIKSGDILLGALRDTNALGDFLVTEFSGSDIIINKHAKITDRDIQCANGYVHQIDQVIEPVKENIYDLIAANPSYSLFAQGLKVTGLSDTLQTVTFRYGKKNARTRFTILAVPDTIFNRFGIHTIDELISYFTNSPDSITYLQNGFYRYMEYHCMANTYYLSGLETKLYPILSYDNNISIAVNNDYKLNQNKLTKKYTGFIIESSNIPAKNGALHTINDLLPVVEPEPARVIFETTDFFDLKQGDYYGKYYQRFFDGEKTFTKIKWEGDYLLYFYSETYTGLRNYDCLKLLGWWTISLTFPKVMKGKYKISIFQPNWPGITNSVVYIDGVLSPYIYTGSYGGTGSSGGQQKIGEAVFPTTTEHTITLRNLAYGELFWDYVIFEPVK